MWPRVPVQNQHELISTWKDIAQNPSKDPSCLQWLPGGRVRAGVDKLHQRCMLSERTPLVELASLVLIHMPCRSYHRQLCPLCLISSTNFPVCWFGMEMRGRCALSKMSHPEVWGQEIVSIPFSIKPTTSAHLDFATESGASWSPLQSVESCSFCVRRRCPCLPCNVLCEETMPMPPLQCVVWGNDAHACLGSQPWVHSVPNIWRFMLSFLWRAAGILHLGKHDGIWMLVNWQTEDCHQVELSPVRNGGPGPLKAWRKSFVFPI